MPESAPEQFNENTEPIKPSDSVKKLARGGKYQMSLADLEREDLLRAMEQEASMMDLSVEDIEAQGLLGSMQLRALHEGEIIEFPDRTKSHRDKGAA